MLQRQRQSTPRVELGEETHSQQTHTKPCQAMWKRAVLSRVVGVRLETLPARFRLRIQDFLYLPSCSIAGIVVTELQFRFPEASWMVMNRTTPEFLSGWKEIAAYLRKGVRTVQRYERHMGLPVRRPAGKAQGSVLATRAELDAWVRGQPCREAFQLKRPTPNISTPAFSALKKGVAKMRRLQQEMLELREELRASVETLQSSLRFICEVRSEELLHRAKQSRTLQTDALQAGDASNVFFLRSGDAKVAEFERAPSRISGD